MSERQIRTPARQLSVHDHSRDSAGLRYVYPVVSRRAGGVSVGINLNVNNACNWACIYCQVPGLARGGPPAVDLDLLEAELRGLLGEIVLGDYLQQHVPEGARRLVDVAFSGNGEPTAAREFEAAVGRVAAVLAELLPGGGLPLRLISNGSLLHRPEVQRGIVQLGACGGEVWFKLDRASPAGVRAVNGVRQRPERALEALSLCATLAPTWVQTCYFALDGALPSCEEQRAYLTALSSVRDKIKGVHLYGVARPSMQPGAARLTAAPLSELERLAAEIAALGLRVTVSA